ncbi:hypothetical protein CEP51_015226 [Fusarium floridanum]|uniref:Ubiquitin-like domain-containing protein n=1 Tax=Fusarium floridanum TaxID=1325733 RepID=A0A428PE66_9HYPO|nr:hypothetical protein CEP51_015226 [Fusarium floridanum]
MAEAIGVAGSIVGIVAFGLQLGVTLQTHIEAAVEASDRLQEIAFEINSTAAVLSQLQAVMKKDCDATVPVFNTDGLRDIKRLSDRCKRIYNVIIILLNEAAEGSENKKLERKVSADGIEDLSLKLNKLGLRRKLAWPWLEPRIKRCQEELRQVKLDLFLHIQVVNLAQYQIQFVQPFLTIWATMQIVSLMQLCNKRHANICVSQNHPTRAPESFEEEQALRELAQELIKKRAIHATKLTRRHIEKTDKAMGVVPTTEAGIAAASAREIICYDRGRDQSEAPPLLATMTQDTQSGKQPEDSLDKPILGSSPGPDGIETTMESNGPKSHDWKRLGNAVHPLPNDLKGREASPVHPSSQLLSRHIYIARDVTTEDETSGSSSHRPSSSNSEDGDPRDDEEGSVQRSTSAPPGTTSFPTVTASSNRILRFIPNWAHDIFSRGRYDDHKSDKLEAFLLELPARTDVKSKLALTKLEIGHTHIEAALSATIPRRWRRGGPQMWEQYKELDPYVRHEIHHAITLAKQWNNQSKTWIATEFMQSSELDQQGRVHVVLFFRLGDEVEPVTLDTGSRNFTLPYEHCRTWEMMEKILIQAFTNTELEDEIRNGRYDIVNNDTNAIIPPRTWRSAILPGMDLKMNVWSLQRRVLRAMPGDWWLRHQAEATGKRVTSTAGRRPLSGGMPPPGDIPPPPEMPAWLRSTPSPEIDKRLSLREERREARNTYWERTVLPNPRPRLARIAMPSSSTTDSESTTNNDKHELDEEMEELLGLEGGISDEIDMSELGLGELLMRWTNAPDAGSNDVLSPDMADR